MAASAALVFAGKSVAAPVISFLVNKAFNYLYKYRKAQGMEGAKDRLLLALPRIQAVLDVVNPERIREQSGAMDAWLWQLRDATEEAEDAIDELEYYELEEKAEDRKVSDHRGSSSSFAKIKRRALKHVAGVRAGAALNRLRKAVDSLDKAAAGVADFLALTNVAAGVASSSQQLEDNGRETGSTLSAPRFVGRDKEKQQIIGWLTRPSSAESGTNGVPIISVVGHGGMGKTTLAQSICQTDEVLAQFKVIWVTVSTSFDATSLTSKMLESASGARPSADHLEPLQQHLKEKLKFVNFLLVLDDVWEDKKRDEWEKLFAPLRKLKTGSKILLTTRMRSVAEMATSVMGVDRDQYLALQGLEEDESLELFNHRVFSGLHPQDYSHFKPIGEQIAKRLGGCPLVTKVASGHLQGNMTFEYWSRFLNEDLRHFKGTQEDIMKVLRLSYYHLPIELQICFRYCCIFPQDYEFKKKDLVQMWMGSGLTLHTGNEKRMLEDMGENYLDQLTRKSFFDVKTRYYIRDGRDHYYVMHDLMHELAEYVSFGECKRIDSPGRFVNVKGTIRHIWVAGINNLSIDEVEKIAHFKNLRTIIIGDESEGGHIVNKEVVCKIEDVLKNSKALRLLRSNVENSVHFHGKLTDFKHLRYAYLHEIPTEGLHGLAKLYHLMLLDCHNGFPKEAKQVRYLGYLDRLRYIPHDHGELPVERLTCLQELRKYIVQGSCNKLSAIRNLRNLRELEMWIFGDVDNHEESKNAKLNEKQQLKSLSLVWLPSIYLGLENTTYDLILDNLEPHANIRELEISHHMGLRLPFWIENLSVKNLVSLKLKSCVNWELLPSLGELVWLKYLTLENLPMLRQIGQSSHVSSSSGCMESFLPPNLDILIVQGCQELQELPILPPSLVHLEISDVGLTKFPRIGKLCSASVETKSSQLPHNFVTDCSGLNLSEGSILVQKQLMGALRDLCIRDCIHLESACLPFEQMEGLRNLTISNCPRLTMLINAGDNKILPLSLELMYIGHCGELELPLLGSLQGLTNLVALSLENSLALVSLPPADVWKYLKSLKHMTIGNCQNLSSLGGLGSLPSRLWLKINSCSKLAEVGSLLTPHASGSNEECQLIPSPLQIYILEIDLPSLLLVEPLKSLCNTQELFIRDASDMESLPEQWLLQNRLSLQNLVLHEVMSLELFPPSMQDLCSLQSFVICGAGQLQLLPDLPASLQHLIVRECDSELETKCREYGSPEWNKISHIPQAKIGRSKFKMGEYCSEETDNKIRSDTDSASRWWKKTCCLG